MVAPHKRESALRLIFRGAEIGWRRLMTSVISPATFASPKLQNGVPGACAGLPRKSHLRERSHQRIADVASVGGGQQR
jgi:hypothetical protein